MNRTPYFTLDLFLTIYSGSVEWPKRNAAVFFSRVIQILA